MMTSKREKNSYGLGLAPGTVKVVRNVLNCAFTFAVNNGLIAENPVSNTKVTARKKPSAGSLTIEEAAAFVSVKGQSWYGNAFVIQLHTGLRNQELMGLIWDDVDFINGALRIERACKWVNGVCVEIGRTKTERSNRVIKLEPGHLALLRLHLENQRKVIEERKKLNASYGDTLVKDWIKKERPRHAHQYIRTNLIFPTIRGTVPYREIVRKAFEFLMMRAGINKNERKLRWYDLRHTHASILLAAGVPPHEVAERMGHSTATLLEMYAHVLEDRRGIASKAFTDLVPI